MGANDSSPNPANPASVHSEKAAEESSTGSEAASAGSLKRRLCRYGKDLCKYGASCKYAHSETELLEGGDQVTNGSNKWKLKANKKPQEHYKIYDKEQYNGHRPFAPLLKVKHHPEQHTCEDFGSSHPYAAEIEAWEVPEAEMTPIDPVEPVSLTTSLTLVKSKSGLMKLRDALNKEKIFAVDLEHHNYHSFRGFTCLVQISTREEDFIVDPFPVWKAMHILNEPFTDPKILKVFHGARSDIIWLQRDFGIYVVNMFDTQEAMRILEFPKMGLSYLIKHYRDIDLEKNFQKADWRLRPLSEEHLSYARMDTHFLLYCYDRLKNELIERDAVKKAYEQSKGVCLLKYEHLEFEADGFLHILSKRHSLNVRQLYVLKELWCWRDKMARCFDESHEFVIPKQVMLKVANNLPTTDEDFDELVPRNLSLFRNNKQMFLEIVEYAETIPLPWNCRRLGVAAAWRWRFFRGLLSMLCFELRVLSHFHELNNFMSYLVCGARQYVSAIAALSDGTRSIRDGTDGSAKFGSFGHEVDCSRWVSEVILDTRRDVICSFAPFTTSPR
ncbi:hypothetical protein L596_029651 [Steinernema carpocapsae]|uniref:C3H1-type domain-containing protein n=1 Tax=Steinernema carpocapsae TaxID=34508 RepID=A0A4V6XVM1_STECR|nr:hypothetical protein L596_029651 [Steinernema carpocapsae]